MKGFIFEIMEIKKYRVQHSTAKTYLFQSITIIQVYIIHPTYSTILLNFMILLIAHVQRAAEIRILFA